MYECQNLQRIMSIFEPNWWHVEKQDLKCSAEWQFCSFFSYIWNLGGNPRRWEKARWGKSLWLDYRVVNKIMCSLGGYGSLNLYPVPFLFTPSFQGIVNIKRESIYTHSTWNCLYFHLCESQWLYSKSYMTFKAEKDWNPTSLFE